MNEYLSPGGRLTPLFLCALLLLSKASLCFAQVDSRLSRGIVVEEVRPGMAGKAAGILSGDVLLSWHRDPCPTAGLAPCAGEFASPFDLVEVLTEQMPRGPVVLEGRRGEEVRVWTLPGGALSDPRAIQSAPLMSGDLLTQYREGEAQIARDFNSGLRFWQAAAAQAIAQGDPALAVWLLAKAAGIASTKNLWGDSDNLYNEALAVHDRTGAAPFIAAQILRDWGYLLRQRSAWDRAENCYQRALTADRQKPFDSLSTALSLMGLGYVDNLSAGSKDDSAFFRQAINIRHRLAPGSADDAMTWFHWGNAATLDRQWQTAMERYEYAATLLAKLDTGRLAQAEALLSLGYAQFHQERFEDAEKTWLRAYRLVQEEAPEDFLMAGLTQWLGISASRRGDLQRAEEFLTQSLEICRRLEPGSYFEADALRELGLLQRKAGKHTPGAQNLCQAMDVIEARRERVQDDAEMRGRVSRFFTAYYQDCADALVEIGRPEDAFWALEKGRARVFLALRAERELRLKPLPPERRQEWAVLDAQYDQIQERLEEIRPRKESRLSDFLNLEGSLREIRRKKERILEQDRPPGSVRYPEPLSLSEARQRLEPGTALLFYSVGETRTLLYVLLPAGAESPGWAVLPLDVGASQLQKKVDSFRDAVTKDRFNQRNLRTPGRDLYDLLVRPAEPYLTSAERIVVSPDGPLHTLPFAALTRGNQYLIEWKPLHFVLSATVYADLLARRPAERSPWKLVAFGEPSYPRPGRSRQGMDEALLRAGLRSEAAPPLPASRDEVQGLASLFPGARTFLGKEATESAAKKAIRDASLIHFAVHGLLNTREPLNSGLILTPPKKSGVDRNNGLLQAWEVMEETPLDADLVTLSACDTALGKELGGEGLISLIRAFQYAGARSVIGTLWGISDRSTSGLMIEFYKALREGRAKDEALREAQIAQIRSAKSAPFYWAAFTLFGDWR